MEKVEDKKKESMLIVVVGIEEIGRQFLLEALTRIISMSGYSVNTGDFEDKQETDFHVIVADEFNLPIEQKARLVFASYRNPIEDIQEEFRAKVIKNKEEFLNEKDQEEIPLEMIRKLYELVKWMRSSKLAYTLDNDAEYNQPGLHNYTNLRNIILPLNFAFERLGMRFDKMKPADLIEALVPELKEKSKQASEKFITRTVEMGEAPEQLEDDGQ